MRMNTYFWYLSAYQDTSIPLRMHIIKFVAHRLTVQLAGYQLHRDIMLTQTEKDNTQDQ